MGVEIIDEPLLARIHRLASPSFPVTYPEMYDDALMPDVIAGSMRAYWTARFFPVRAVDFYRLRNVYVCGEGLVFDAAGRLFRSTIAQHSDEAIAVAAQAVAEARAVGQIPAHSGPAVLCKKIGSFNFGHWLLEMWPRAILARMHLAIPGLRYVVHAHTGALWKVMRDCLGLAGIREAAIIETTWEPQFFEDLFLVDGLTDHGNYMSSLAVTCLDPFIEGVPAGHAERLYVTRQGVGWRRFQDEEAMLRIAEQEGYMVIDPGGMGLMQQIGMFKGARRVVGVTGAAMTNTVFMAPHGRVDLFVPASMPDNFFWFISQHRQHHYSEHRCPEAEPDAARREHGQSWNADIEFAPEAFRRFIGG